MVHIKAIHCKNGLQNLLAENLIFSFTFQASVQPGVIENRGNQQHRISTGHLGLGNLDRIDNEVLSYALDEPYSIAEGKVDCIKAFIHGSRRPLFAVGDSVYDLPMVEYADLHAVVERDSALTQEALRRGWFVLPS